MQPTPIERQDSEDLSDDWEAKDDIAARIAENQLLQKERQESAELRRRRNLLIALAFTSITIVTVGYWFIRFYLTTREASVSSQQNGQNPSITIEPKTNLLNYNLTRASIVLPNQGSFEIRQYEFDSNRFRKGQTVLENEDVFRKTVSSLNEELQDSWVVIFAGASIDGDSLDNRNLCRERVLAIASIIRQSITTSPRVFLGIPAGAKKSEEGSIVGKSPGIPEKELARQRILLIYVIQAINPRAGGSQNGPPRELFRVLYDNGLIPKGYEYQGGEPAELDTP